LCRLRLIWRLIHLLLFVWVAAPVVFWDRQHVLLVRLFVQQFGHYAAEGVVVFEFLEGNSA
jgi:hypothetical protein